ncbi:MAG: hypothetical protein ACRBBR_14385 [Cellvibrionaceae bacterium]
MHIIIGIITAIAGLLWALNSLQNAGVDLNAFNPFTWVRRRKWKKKMGVKPMHSLTDSIDAAALLVVSVVKSTGEITRDSKMEILNMFEKEFGIKRNKSIELFSASTYMLKEVMNMAPEVQHVLAPNKHEFENSHITKLLEMLNKAAALEEEPSPEQIAVIDAVKKEFDVNKEQASNW